MGGGMQAVLSPQGLVNPQGSLGSQMKLLRKLTANPPGTSGMRLWNRLHDAGRSLTIVSLQGHARA